MANFRPKPWVNPLQKSQFFDFLNLLFLSPTKAFFRSEYRKTLFPGLYCLKPKDGKMANFGPKFLQNWTKIAPSQKSQFFHCLNMLFLKPRKAFFRSRIS